MIFRREHNSLRRSNEIIVFVMTPAQVCGIPHVHLDLETFHWKWNCGKSSGLILGDGRNSGCFLELLSFSSFRPNVELSLKEGKKEVCRLHFAQALAKIAVEIFSRFSLRQIQFL